MVSNSRIIEVVVKLNDQITQGINSAATSIQRNGQQIRNVGAGLTAGITVPLGLAGAAAVQTAIDFERSFAMVQKSVDGTPEQLSALNNELRRLATETPLGAMENAHAELDRIAAAAGRLGVGVEDIPKFTEAIGALAVAADGLDAETAAEQIARFANVTGMSLGDVDKLGDVIADLGNNFATTEVDILNFGTRMSTLSQFGFVESEILALGTAMSAAGLTAELGSTSFVKGMSNITKAVALGSPKLDAFADVLDMTTKQAEDLFKSDPASAVLMFSEALGDMPVDQQLMALEQMGFTGTEIQRTFMSLAGSSDTLANALERGAIAFQGNGAAMREAEALAATTAGQLNLLRSNFALLANALGVVVLPVINSLIQILLPMVQSIAQAPPAIQRLVVVFAALIAAIGPLLLIIGQLLTMFSTLMTVIGAIGPVIAALSGPIGWVVLALGALFIAYQQNLWGIRDLINSFFAWVSGPSGGDSGVLNWFTILKDVIITSYRAIINPIKSIKELLSILFRGDFIGLMGLSEDHPIVGALFQIRDGAIIAYEAIKGVIEKMNIEIPSLLGDLPNLLMSVGTAVISSFLLGMEKLFPETYNKVREFANKVSSALRAAFKIRSPSRVMMEIGNQVTAGFQQGVNAEGGMQVPPPSIPAIGSSGAGYSGVGMLANTINISVPPGTTQEQVDMILKQLGREARRRGAIGRY